MTRGGQCATRSAASASIRTVFPMRWRPPSAIGYLEFHIEQGPVLDDLNLPLAVVDVISGQSRADVTFSGMAAHAGTTPMTAAEGCARLRGRLDRARSSAKRSPLRGSLRRSGESTCSRERVMSSRSNATAVPRCPASDRHRAKRQPEARRRCAADEIALPTRAEGRPASRALISRRWPWIRRLPRCSSARSSAQDFRPIAWPAARVTTR